jgi:putative acetyltransferase
MPELVLRRADEGDTDRLVEVWRAAVEATHHFLSPSDVDGYSGRLAAEFFPMVELVVAELNSRIVGFSGTTEGRLEMLFVDPAAHGRGVGTALLDRAVHAQGATDVDVNEQNPDAVAFYKRRGFEQIGRSPLDSDGRPFPLLHMRRTNAQTRDESTA